jgi:SAM-dependent methyltransferase
MTSLSLRSALRRLPLARRAVLTARFGDLRRARPLTEWGDQRGAPVDRWYIERFLWGHAEVVTGHVLEVKEDLYASALGAASVDVLDIDPDNARATVVGDLCEPATLAGRAFDAAVVTQTLQYVSDPVAALRNLLQSLQPGGALLVTVPCSARVDGPADLWRWTPSGLGRQLRAALGGSSADVEVSGLGNCLAARGFLFGLAAEDLDPAALEVRDPAYPMVIGAKVRLTG